MDGATLLALIFIGAVFWGVLKFARGSEEKLVDRKIDRPSEDAQLPPLNLPDAPRTSSPHIWTASDCADGEWRKLLTDGVHDAVDEDTGEMVTIHPQTASDHVEGVLVSFGYRDASDNPSRRMLLCARCWQEHGALYVRGYCTLRNAFRTFRPDRMIDLKEMRSGSPIADPEAYFEQFAAVGAAKEKAASAAEVGRQNPQWKAKQEAYEAAYQASRAAAAVKKQAQFEARDACISGLRILAYIALCDGVVVGKERDIQSAFIKARLAATDRESDGATIDAMLSIARGLAVPDRSFAAAINKVNAEGYGSVMLDYAEKLAGSDESISPKEQTALDRLRKSLK
jgi:WYL domain